MTRKDQYVAFLPFFQAEEERYTALTQRATTFLGLTSIIVLFGGVDMGARSGQFWPRSFTIVTAVAVVLAVLSAIASLWIRAYKHICAVEELIVTIENNGLAEKDIYSKLLAGMAEATRHNRALNTKRAKWLRFSATSFAFAVLFAASAAISPWHEKHNEPQINQISEINGATR